MAHARNINGGLNYSKARKQGATPDKLRELRMAAHGQGSSITTTTVAGTGQRVAIGHRIGSSGNVRCRHCEKVSHNRSGNGPHTCDQCKCGREFVTAD